MVRSIRPHLKYLSYVLRHKWFVFRAGLMLRREHGFPVSIWQLLIHDWTKFTPREWGPYVRHFYGPKPSPRGEDGSYDPASVGGDYDLAWLSHQRNKHHWQAWVLLGDEGWKKPLQMPIQYVGEMLADWMGAGMAINGHGLDRAIHETRFWYVKNSGKMVLHSATRYEVEEFLGIFTPVASL